MSDIKQNGIHYKRVWLIIFIRARKKHEKHDRSELDSSLFDKSHR